MSLKPNYEPKIYELHPNIIAFGSYERDGSFPYVYNNEQAGIIMQDLDDDFVTTDNNNIRAYKTVEYKQNKYTVPLIKSQIEYQIINAIAKNNNSRCSVVYVSPLYKALYSNIDSNGMLVLGIKYDLESSYKFKTIGVRALYTINNYQYGIYIWAEALQYDQDDDGNTTITSLTTSNKTFIPYNYSFDNVTMMTTFEEDTDNNKLIIEYKSVEKDQEGNRLFDFDFSLDTDDDNAKYSSNKIDSIITMPELNQSIEYSLYHIKTFGNKLSLNTLEHQSNILITL